VKEIINWLITVEHLANDFYFEASKLFSEDRELTEFLKHIAEDEAYHYHIMGSAAGYLLRSKSARPVSIIVDDSIKGKISEPLVKNIALARNKTLTREILIDSIVESEFSEWNDIFLYVVNSIKEEERVFAHAASKIQHHLKHIEWYLNTTSYGRQQLEKFRGIPHIWKEKILIVDDEEVITSLLSAVLEREWQIDTAADGAAALAKIKENFYDLIISDIDMPIMDGLELYKNAAEYIKNPTDIFIFHTGNLSPDLKKHFAQNKLKFLAKPSSIAEIRNLVNDTLQKTALAKNFNQTGHHQ
jgi:CheY-like chemotaxis protein